MAPVDAPPEPEGDESVDGRRQRRERNREAVVDALLTMIDSGDLDPTIAEVATVAGLSARSVFRYFDDVDDLVRAAVRRQQERLAPRMALPIDLGAPRSERIRGFVDHRIDVLEAMGNVGRVARLRAPIQPLVADELARIRSVLLGELQRCFATELEGCPDRALLVAAADAVCSFEAYDAMVRDHGFGREQAGASMVAALERLVPGGPR